MTDQLPVNVGDEASVKESRGKAKRTKRQREDDLRAVMATRPGRAVIWGLLELAGIYRTTFIPGAPDVAAFNEGARNLGLQLLAEVQAICPELYDLAKQEARQKEEA